MEKNCKHFLKIFHVHQVHQNIIALESAAVETGHASIHLDESLGGTFDAELRIGREVTSLIAGGFLLRWRVFSVRMLLGDELLARASGSSV